MSSSSSPADAKTPEEMRRFFVNLSDACKDPDEAPPVPGEADTPQQLVRFFVCLCASCEDPLWVQFFMDRCLDLDLNRPEFSPKNPNDMHLGLHAAAAEGHVSTLALLLSSARIDPFALDLNDKTALAVAIDAQQTSAFWFLLHHPRIATQGAVHDQHVVCRIKDKPVTLKEYLASEAGRNCSARSLLGVILLNTMEAEGREIK